jgi:hypothetical protein
LASNPEFASQPKPLPPIESTAPSPTPSSPILRTSSSATPINELSGDTQIQELSLDEQFKLELMKAEQRLESSTTSFTALLERPLNMNGLESSYLESVFEASEKAQAYTEFIPTFAPTITTGFVSDELLDQMISKYAERAAKDADELGDDEDGNVVNLAGMASAAAVGVSIPTTVSRASTGTTTHEGGAEVKIRNVNIKDDYYMEHSHFIDIPDDIEIQRRVEEAESGAEDVEADEQSWDVDWSSVPLLQQPHVPDDNGVIPGEDDYDDESFESPGVLEAELEENITRTQKSNQTTAQSSTPISATATSQVSDKIHISTQTTSRLSSKTSKQQPRSNVEERGFEEKTNSLMSDLIYLIRSPGIPGEMVSPLYNHLLLKHFPSLGNSKPQPTGKSLDSTSHLFY